MHLLGRIVYTQLCFVRLHCLNRVVALLNFTFHFLCLSDSSWPVKFINSQGSLRQDASCVQRSVISGLKHLKPSCFQVKASSFLSTVLASRSHHVSYFSTTHLSKVPTVANRRMVCTNSMAGVSSSLYLFSTDFVLYISCLSQILENGFLLYKFY